MNHLDNQFKMMRVLIALCHIDHQLDKREVKWIKNTIKRFEFTPDQLETLDQELQRPSADFLEIFKSINNHSARAKTLDLARYAFCLDEKLCHREKEVFKELKSIHNNSSPINPQDQKKVAQSIIEQENSKNFYRDLEVLGKTLNQKPTRLTSFFPQSDWVVQSLMNGNWMTRIVLIIFVLYLIGLGIYKANMR